MRNAFPVRSRMPAPTIVLVRPAYSTAIYGEVFGKNEIDKREIRPPLGLMALTGYLERHGYGARILDGEPELWDAERTVSEVLALGPDLVGLTSTTPEWPFALEIASRLKSRRPELTVVIGGAHVTNLPMQSLAEAGDAVDYGVLYEGELALLAIVEGRARDMVWKPGNDPRLLLAPARLTGAELSAFTPSRRALDMSPYKYVDTGVGLVANDAIEAARGCPFGCAFCTSRRTLLAQREVGVVVDEIVASARDHGTRLFMFFDDTFTLHRAYAEELFRAILARKRQGALDRNVSFYGFTRANTIDADLMALIKRAGGDKISIGVETGDPEILAAMQKGTKLSDYVTAFAMLGELGYTKRASFIVGHPYETETTIRRSIDFALALDLDEIGVNIMTPFPGQTTFRDAQQGRGIWFSHDIHYGGASPVDFRAFAAVDWADYWREHLRWQRAVVETEVLSSDALAYWHRRFLQEVYGSTAMASRRAAKIAEGVKDEYWHRTWRSQAARNAERLEREAAEGMPVFPAPRHLGETYRPVSMIDIQKNELYLSAAREKRAARAS